MVCLHSQHAASRAHSKRVFENGAQWWASSISRGEILDAVRIFPDRSMALSSDLALPLVGCWRDISYALPGSGYSRRRKTLGIVGTWLEFGPVFALLILSRLRSPEPGPPGSPGSLLWATKSSIQRISKKLRISRVS